jgi:hypothetical protein
MRKSLLLALSLFSSFFVSAQESLFDLETDTVCVGQEVHLKPTAMNARSYYWGFCSGYLGNVPLMDNLGPNFQFDVPSNMEVAKDGNNYYGFVVNNSQSGTPNGELLRLNFGTSLKNVPTVTNFGNLDSSVCPNANSLYMLQDNGNWHLFMCGGTDATNSTVARIDFGKNLANQPNGVRMGNPGGLLIAPRGIFVGKQGDLYYGFMVNSVRLNATAPYRMVRLDFGNNVSKTPTAQNVTIIASGGGFGSAAVAMKQPMDLAPIYDKGNWYFFVPNAGTNVVGSMGPPPVQASAGENIMRFYFGNSLTNNPVATFVTPTGSNSPVPNPLDSPYAINMVKDCGGYYAYVADRKKEVLYRYDLPDLNASDLLPAGSYNPTGVFTTPVDITRVIRDGDSLFSFVLNETSNELVRLTYPQCHDVNIQSSSLPNPPAFKYDSSGLHNIYLVVNEGLPNMAVDCKQVRVIQVPPMTLTPDTLICQGDTLHLQVASQYASDYFFSPDYNISALSGINVYVYPRHTFTYNIRIPFPFGCIVDTTIKVDVSMVKADAGPDRTLYDGAKTVIGGANTYRGPEYTFEWFPTQYMDNPFSLNPTVSPNTDLTYYLKVTNTDGCVAIDTVNVKVVCADLNLPNAFMPVNERGTPTRFGLLNRQIVKLNYFRIFDRWGQEVFSTTDITKEWDGNVGGEPAPLGVYVWEADGYCSSGIRVNKSGNVTLIR